MAQFNLGVAFHNGRGVKQNIVEAVKYYEKAAMQGHPDAQYNLGVLYFQGIGVDQSYELALEWFQKAAERGESLAQCNLVPVPVVLSSVPRPGEPGSRINKRAHRK